jgi:hypothetical protein
MARIKRKTRAILSGLGVGLASIYFIAYYFNVELGTLNSFLFGTLLFFVSVVLLAAIAVVVFKLLARLFGGRHNDSG